METKNLLLELGTEELPPKALRKLACALENEFANLLKASDLNFSNIKYYATPRRLALYIEQLDTKQKDKTIEIKGPTVKAAYDDKGNPTKAAIGWANANKVDLNKVQTLKTDKGEWLFIKVLKPGKETKELVRDLFASALTKLPIPKLMHWGDKKEEFVRPVHTLCLLFGDELIPGSILGIESSNQLNGHRFLCNHKLTINHAEDYENLLLKEGNVVADFDKRKNMIKEQIINIADSYQASADLDDDLLEEVTSLVEYPQAYAGKFEDKFLEVPAEALVYTMKGDQKYFPLYDKNKKLIPYFIFISNIHPENTTSLISGNEKVVRPRLADAQFFFNTDRKHSLESFHSKLEKIVYQKDIGTIAYRSSIVEKVAEYIANKIGADQTLAKRAAYLAKCDLATTLVTEFTDTQGVIGMHYAKMDGENDSVANAIFEQYLPRFAGDIIPTQKVEISLSLAEKIVTLVSIYGINMIPKGDKDPYGLRRAAIGFIRILIENKLSLNLTDLISFVADLFKEQIKLKDTAQLVQSYILQRLKAYYQDQNIGAEIFLSVLDVKPDDLLDFDKRVKAVVEFKQCKEAADLASLYKRIANILSKSTNQSDRIDSSLLTDQYEIALVSKLKDLEPVVNNYYNKMDYQQALISLSSLRDVVDQFFEHVMVNVNDEKVKINRIAILTQLKNILSKTANISVLY